MFDEQIPRHVEEQYAFTLNKTVIFGNRSRSVLRRPDDVNVKP